MYKHHRPHEHKINPRPHEKSLGQQMDEMEAGATTRFATKDDHFAIAQKLGISREDFDEFYGKTMDQIVHGAGSSAYSEAELAQRLGLSRADIAKFSGRTVDEILAERAELEESR